MKNNYEVILGEQLRDLRVRQNISQQVLAERACIALNAVKNLEAGNGSTVSSLLQVLHTLGKESWIQTLAPTVSISPMQMLKQKPKRQRASKPKPKVKAKTNSKGKVNRNV